MDTIVDNGIEIPWRRAVLSVDQFAKPDITDIFATANRLAVGRTMPLGGKTIANLFYEPSTRTSSSFYAAMTKLGGNVIPINEVNYSSVSKGETLEDTIRTLECYVDAIVLRHYDDDATERAYNVASVPIINAGNGSGEHPTQALLDLYTIQLERGRIDGLTVTMMGDLKYGRTVHSLSKLLQLYDVKLQFVAPDELRMPSKYLTEGDREFDDLDDVIADTDILYVTRVQKERISGSIDIDFKYAVRPEHMARAREDMALMHPMPRVGEVPESLDNDPRSAYFRQMRYGLYVRMALLVAMLGGG
ncbi:aspartate carbamoyltransferase [Alphaproteobacteria bacterium]|nr:aspartate carbamoyltransferase [Alphaproteobacteria bacterium]